MATIVSEDPIAGVSTRVVDSALGAWRQTDWRPPNLAGVVDRIWHFDGWLAHPRERIFPNGMLEIIVHLGSRYRPGDRDGADPYPVTCVTGMMLGSSVIEAPPERCAVLGIRLHPTGAFAVLGQPLSPMNDLTVDLAALVGPLADELVERCAEARSGSDCVRIAATWIAERLCRANAADRAIQWAACEIERARGAIPITALRERTGLSKMRFANAFREQVGVTPKLYARIHRFRWFLELLHHGDDSLARLALRAGYYDQPHMNAEFREMTGLAPTEYLAALRYPASVSVAEG